MLVWRKLGVLGNRRQRGRSQNDMKQPNIGNPATRNARVLQHFCVALETGGRREHRMLAAPASLACKKRCTLRTQDQQGSQDNRRPLRNGLTAYTWSPRCTLPVSHRRLAHRSQDLIPASGNRDRTISPYAIRASSLRAPRPSHPAPNVRDDRDTPLQWRRDAGIKSCLSEKRKQNIFGARVDITSD